MEVEIIDKQDDKVQVNTIFGRFDGVWCSPNPAISKRYVVELDSDEVLTADMIGLSDSCNPHIERVGNTINVTGLVEEIQDRVMVLRLQKSQMMLEISSHSIFSHCLGQYICVRLSEIKLYDTETY